MLASGLAVAAIGAGSGCGSGGGGDPSAYRASLDAACRRSFDATAALPQRQRDERLSIAAVRLEATAIGQRFRDDIAALDPPDDLRDDHDALVAASGSAPFAADADLAMVIARLESFRDRYAALGATGCMRGLDTSIASLRAPPTSTTP